MGKKKHKKAPTSVKQKDVQVENTQQTAEQAIEEAQVAEEMPLEQDVQPDVTEQENLQEPEGQTEEILQEAAVPEEENQEEKNLHESESQAEETAQEQNESVEEAPQEQAETAEDTPEPVVQIKEWKESEPASTNADALTADDEKTEKKTKVLMWAGIAMLGIVVVAGIAIGFSGRDKGTVSTNSGAVATPTVEAESEPTKQAENKPDEEATPTPTLEQTKEPVATPTSPPEPTKEEEKEPTKAPTSTPTVTPSPMESVASTVTPTTEPTKAPTVTPTAGPTKAPTTTSAPVVVGDIDVSKYSAYSNKAEGWGIGKNTEHKQPTAWGYDDKYKFDEVGAWYVDKNASEDDKVIYLTFNCGYEVGYTPGFLEVLKKHDVKASWFVLEEYIRQCPEEIRWLMENGHLVGSHSAYHLNYGTSSPEAVIKDMLKNEQRMRDYVGLEMHKIMRPPSGYYNEQTLRIMKDLGYKIYFWSLAYPDWNPNDQPTEEYILNYFQANHHNGAIPVIHITSGAGMRVLDEVITMLKAEGYRFGLVSEIE